MPLFRFNTLSLYDTMDDLLVTKDFDKTHQSLNAENDTQCGVDINNYVLI